MDNHFFNSGMVTSTTFDSYSQAFSHLYLLHLWLYKRSWFSFFSQFISCSSCASDRLVAAAFFFLFFFLVLFLILLLLRQPLSVLLVSGLIAIPIESWVVWVKFCDIYCISGITSLIGLLMHLCPPPPVYLMCPLLLFEWHLYIIMYLPKKSNVIFIVPLYRRS